MYSVQADFMLTTLYYRNILTSVGSLFFVITTGFGSAPAILLNHECTYYIPVRPTETILISDNIDHPICEPICAHWYLIQVCTYMWWLARTHTYIKQVHAYMVWNRYIRSQLFWELANYTSIKCEIHKIARALKITWKWHYKNLVFMALNYNATCPLASMAKLI